MWQKGNGEVQGKLRVFKKNLLYMAEELKTEVVLKDPINIVFETKKNEDKAEYWNSHRLDLVKWLIGTVGLGIITLTLNECHYQNEQEIKKTEYFNEQKIKRTESDIKLITSVNYDTNLQSQLKYLLSIKPFIATDTFRSIVDSQINNLLILSNPNAVVSNTITAAAEKSETKLSPEQIKKLKTQANVTISVNDTLQKSISIFKAKEDSILITQGLTPIDSGVIKKITEANILSVKQEKNDYTLQGIPRTLWCKQGYYIEFNNTLRIGINKLNNNEQTITVNFKDIEENPTNPTMIQDDVIIAAEQTLILDRKNYRYQITLNYIGAAGEIHLQKQLT